MYFQCARALPITTSTRNDVSALFKLRPAFRPLRRSLPLQQLRTMGSSGATFQPKLAARVATSKQDVWSIVNEAAANTPKQPVVNMGQGFFGYNPPDYVLNAAKEAIGRVDCNQYAPTKGRPRLKKAVADAHSASFGRTLNPDTEVVITTGANEAMLSAFMAFLEPGDEVIIFEPFFDQYIANIQWPGGVIRSVPLIPPAEGSTRTCSSAEWKIDFELLERTFSGKTKIVVLNTPHNPLGKVFDGGELRRIGELCKKHDTLVLSDEVYDRLYYKSFPRIAALSDDLWARTLTVGSGGKNFYCTGWRVGWLMGPANLIAPCATAHTRICYSTPSPLQEAMAIAFERADELKFWDTTRRDMRAKMDRFCAVFDELGLPYSNPDGGYFVVVNTAKIKVPDGYPIPPHVEERPRDFHLCWFLITELGVAAIPPSEFYSPENQFKNQDYMRFAVCKNDDVLDSAKERLRGLKKYIV